MEINLQQAQKDTELWLENFAEMPTEAMGGFAVCPYAKAARTNKKITFRLGVHPYEDLVEHAKQGNQGYDVFLYVYDPSKWDPSQFHDMVYQANDENLAQADLISLPDHPYQHESVNGLVMNQGKYAYNMIAPLGALNEASAKLHKAGYYEQWKDVTDEYMDDLFRSRKDPRKQN
jgi:hypothetical protein